jgi:hypothetical protein
MSKTPPPGPLLIPETPVHTRTTTTDRFGLKFENRGSVFERLSQEMAPYFVGPMPPQDFLDSFLPNSPLNSSIESGVFTGLTQAASEADMYTTFVRPPQPIIPLLMKLICSSANAFPHISQAWIWSIHPARATSCPTRSSLSYVGLTILSMQRVANTKTNSGPLLRSFSSSSKKHRIRTPLHSYPLAILSHRTRRAGHSLASWSHRPRFRAPLLTLRARVARWQGRLLPMPL